MKKRKIMLAFFGMVCYYIQALRRASKYPGVAKFGIALEWGSRGRWFESSHSDQQMGNSICCFLFVISKRLKRTSGLLYFNCRREGRAQHSLPTGSNPVTRTRKRRVSIETRRFQLYSPLASDIRLRRVLEANIISLKPYVSISLLQSKNITLCGSAAYHFHMVESNQRPLVFYA